MEIFKILKEKRSLEEWNIPHRRWFGEWRIEFKEEYRVLNKMLDEIKDKYTI